MIIMIKYNEKLDRYIDDNGNIFKMNSNVLELCKTCLNNCGYEQLNINNHTYLVHRIVFQTFVGDIEKGFDIDHIDIDKTNNSLKNLQKLSHKENVIKISKRKPYSDFGRKFFEHYGILKTENINLYAREHYFYSKNNYKCSWEINR